MTDNEIIGEIQKVREQNNKCWMSILKIAFSTSPREAREIFRKITKNDKKINQYSKELCDK